MQIDKKYIVLPIIGVVLYFALSYHFIFFGSIKPYFLKKTKLTLEETIVGVSKARSMESVLSNKLLRDAGLGALLVQRGYLTEDALATIMAKYQD